MNKQINYKEIMFPICDISQKDNGRNPIPFLKSRRNGWDFYDFLGFPEIC